MGLVTLLDIPNLQLLPLRQGREWQHNHDHSHDHAIDDHATVQDTNNMAIDPHFWLSTQNAEIVVTYLASYLAKIDPSHASQYLTNAKKVSI